jgi:ribosomal subunit interface protein
MNYTENYKGIKLDIQAVDTHIPDGVQETIREAIDKIGKHAPEINFFDVYLKNENHATDNKNVRIRVGVPGPDVFAEENGEHWETAIRAVTHKLIRQLDKKGD